MQTKLYRSRQNKVIAGIAAGLGKYFDVDPVLVRVIFIVFAVFGGPGFLAYIILWIVMPWEPESAVLPAVEVGDESGQALTPVDSEEQKKRRQLGGAMLLICLGLMFVVEHFVPMYNLKIMLPIALIAIGAILL
ncbi:MAG: PspC domain-containing protein, partial [Chlorobiales bacterium]|nr:PspC domain-containing protein [Chlorobiales bacterium]